MVTPQVPSEKYKKMAFPPPKAYEVAHVASKYSFLKNKHTILGFK